MPYRWTYDQTETPKATAHLRLWPHQSLTGRGLVWFIGTTAVLFAVPLIAVLGSPVLWVLLFFVAAAGAGIWWAIMANRAGRRTLEDLWLSRDRVYLRHLPPGGDAKDWEANPYWIEIGLRPEGGPVENYLTLRGGGREVELGRFLSPGERARLKNELTAELARLR